MRTAILGASRKTERYSNRALQMLKSHGHEVVPVHPLASEIEGVPVVSSLDEIAKKIHTLTLYVGPRHSESEIPAILRLRPSRVIFNPGTESPALMEALDQAGIPYLRACTLVLLATGQYERAA